MNAVALFEHAAGDAEDVAYAECGALHAPIFAERYGLTVTDWLARSVESRSALTFSAVHAEPDLEYVLEEAEERAELYYRARARSLSLRLIAERAVAGEIPALTLPELVGNEPERLEVHYEHEHAPPLTTRVSRSPRSPHAPPVSAGYFTALGGTTHSLGENGPPP